MLTPAVPCTQSSALLRSALRSILTVGLVLLAAGALAEARLNLGPWYLLKVALVFGADAVLLLRGLSRSHPFDRLGAANFITLIRGALVALLAGLIGDRVGTGVPAVAAATGLAVTALDGLDGRLARRAGMSSGLGARFDMETDAALVAVLATLAWQFGKAGPWVLLSGLMRYLFAAAGLLVPLLRRPLSGTFRGKAIAVIQMLALEAVIAPRCPPALGAYIAGAALAALTVSFALDIVRLARRPVPR